MLLTAIYTDDTTEISTQIISSTRVKYISTNKQSRIADACYFVRMGHDWINTSTLARADDLKSHILDYSVSKWYTTMTEERTQMVAFLNSISSQPTDLDEQRQTNSFSGPNWN